MESKKINYLEEGPLIVILGQTASGKTDLAIKIAQRYEGEIICADSRTVYKGMHIGTAKPTESDRKTIKHHILDIIEPSKAYSASDFKRDAIKAIDHIRSKSKIPIVTGGTGLYIDSLVYDFDFGNSPEPSLRDEIQNLSLAELQEEVKALGLSYEEIDYKNKRHLVRAIENRGIVRSKKPINRNTLVLGIKKRDEQLKNRIRLRNEKMIKDGLEKEVETLAGKYGWDAPGLNAIAYKEWREYFSGNQNIDQVKENMFKDNWQYARRQKIWFKRNKDIYWSTSVKDLIRQVDQFLIQY